MGQDTDQPAAAAVGEHPTDDDGRSEEAAVPVDEDAGDHDGADLRLTRRVHVILGLVVAVLGAWLLYLSHTELAFRGRTTSLGPAIFPCC